MKFGVRNPELYMITQSGEMRPNRDAQTPQSWVVETDMVLSDPLELSRLIVV